MITMNGPALLVTRLGPGEKSSGSLSRCAVIESLSSASLGADLPKLISSDKLESYQIDVSDHLSRYVKPSPSSHGLDGYVKP